MKESAGKRVLMLLENCTYPLDIRVRYEAEALVSIGYQAAVICQRGVKEPWREMINRVSVYRYPAPPQAKGFLGYLVEYSYSLLAAFILSLFVSLTHGFDIIHAANPPDTAVFIALFYKPFGKKFVFDHHDLVPDMYLARSKNQGSQAFYRILTWLERLSFRYADHVIATNQSYQAVAIERGHVSADKITVVRNGPALERLKLVDPDPELKKRASIIIGYIGVMGPQDGLDYLLRAIQQLITVLQRNDFFCVIIGKGSALAELKAYAGQLGLEQTVWFTGFIPEADMLRYLSTCDICVDPDPSNSFNDRCTMVKMMEYMTLQKPIVAFDLPEHRVTAGEAALFARPNDELDFARQIAILMDDPERRKRMGEIGRERVENQLAWPFQKKSLLKAYESLSQDLKHPIHETENQNQAYPEK
jgi:glycosyltransferase involved in cell wall biosynthesis